MSKTARAHLKRKQEQEAATRDQLALLSSWAYASALSFSAGELQWRAEGLMDMIDAAGPSDSSIGARQRTALLAGYMRAASERGMLRE